MAVANKCHFQMGAYRDQVGDGRLNGHSRKRCLMFTRSKARGLCAACEHEPGCIYEADSDHIILQCEQFKMQFPAPADPLALSSPRSLSSNGHNSNKFAGLCMNCDN